MKKIIFLLLFFLCGNTFADDISIKKVEISPLTGGISFNTVITSSVLGWVTANSVRGRKEIVIINTSTTENAYLAGVSGSSAIGTILPQANATFKVGSNLNIFVSANSAVPISIEIWEVR